MSDEHFALAIVHIDQRTEVSAETWEVYISGFTREDDEESSDLNDFNDRSWYDSKEQAQAEAKLLADYLIKFCDVDKCVILLEGNEIACLHREKEQVETKPLQIVSIAIDQLKKPKDTNWKIRLTGWTADNVEDSSSLAEFCTATVYDNGIQAVMHAKELADKLLANNITVSCIVFLEGYELALYYKEEVNEPI